MFSRWVLTVALALACAAPPAFARAQAEAAPAVDGAPVAAPRASSARDLFTRGQAAYQQGDYASAAALWEQAYALEARPQLQYNLAQAYGRLGRLEEERAALDRFISAAPSDGEVVVSARARLAMIEQRLARTGIVLAGAPYDGAVVLVDGEDRGRLPHPEAFAVRPGRHAVEVRLAGHEPFRAAVVVPAGEQVEVEVELLPAPEVSARASRRALPIALYAAGGGLVAAGAVFGGLALANTSDTPVSGTAAADRAHAFSILSDVTLVTGVAAGATGLVLHLVRRGHGPAEESVAVTPVVAPTLVGLEAAGRF